MIRLSARRRRGSIFVLVIAILAVLVLLTLSLTYVSRAELMSSRNFVDQIQSRTSSFTGVPPFDPGDTDPIVIGMGASAPVSSLNAYNHEIVGLSLRLDSKKLNEIKATAGEVLRNERELKKERPGAVAAGAVNYARASDSALARKLEDERVKKERDRAELKSEDLYASLASFQTHLGKGFVEDESAKININAVAPAPANASGPADNAPMTLKRLGEPDRPGPAPVIDAASFGAFIDKILRSKEIHAGASGLQIADAIIERRYGPDGKPGIAGVDDNGNSGQVNPNADGLDNDQDGVIDNPEEETMSPAADGLDNDRDGEIDETDESLESDGVDNNGDGRVDEPGEGIDEPEEFSPDLRLRARGDDRPYASLAELMDVRGMTPEALAALAPYLTVFSVSPAAYPVGDPNKNQGRRQIDPNTAPPREMFAALREAYPRLPEELIGQFVVNIVDRRDTDDTPSRIELGPQNKAYIGFELTPRINEVGSYTGAPDQGVAGDDGQFVEIINPHKKPFSLAGWRLEGVGTTVYLEGTLQPEGLLVITDDYNNSTDPQPEDIAGQGSLYDVYGATPNSKAKVRVEPGLNIPDDEGEIRLLNPEGVQVDSFRYRDGRLVGSARKTFQRLDPLVGKGLYTRADAKRGTPLRPNFGLTQRSEVDKALIEAVENLHNRPFRSPLEVLLVMTNYTEVAVEENRDNATPTPAPGRDPIPGGDSADPAPEREEQVWAEQSRTIRLPGVGGGEGRNFDFSVADVFLPGAPARRQTQIFATSSLGSSSQAEAAAAAAELSDPARRLRDQPPSPHGRINVNTAPGVVLAALPGMNDDLAFRIVYLRSLWLRGTLDPTAQIPRRANDAFKTGPDWLEAAPPMDAPRWRKFSDLLTDNQLWGDADLFTRVAQLYPVSLDLTCQTLALGLVTENLPNPQPGGDGQRLPTVLKTTRIVAGDRGGPETVAFQMGDAVNFSGYDKDIVYGAPAQPLPPELDPRQPVQLKRVDSKEAALHNAELDAARRSQKQMGDLKKERDRELARRNRAASAKSRASGSNPAPTGLSSGLTGSPRSGR